MLWHRSIRTYHISRAFFVYLITLQLIRMKNLIKFSSLVILLLVAKNSNAKDYDSAVSKAQLYISTNKDLYVFAETVYYQVFLMAENRVVPASATLNAELYNCSGGKISKEKIPLINGLAAGSFRLPEQQSDYYLLYCYTLDNNGKPVNDFTKKIIIKGNSTGIISTNNVDYSVNNLSIDFFAEGGTFVGDLNNNLLIKASTKTDNKPIQISGKIINQKNEVIHVFSTDAHGFVKLEMVPFENENLSMVVQDNQHNTRTIPLPKIASQGMSFRITPFQNEIFYIAQLNAQSNNIPLNYYLGIFSKGRSVYQGDMKFDRGKSQLYEEIKKTDLPGGYLTFKIADENNKNVIERIFYNDVNNSVAPLRIVDSIMHKTYYVDLPDYVSGKGYISINAFEQSKAGIIDSNATTLGGCLKMPALDKSYNYSKFCDYLISLHDMASNVTQTNSPDENGLLAITGTLYSYENKPLKNKKVNIIIIETGNKKQYHTTNTDEHGRLKLTDLVFFDTAVIYYQLADKSENKNRVNLVLDENVDKKISTLYNNDRIKDFLCSEKAENNTLKAASVNEADSTAKGYKTIKEVIVNASSKKTDKEFFVKKYVSSAYNFTPALDKEFDFMTNPDETQEFESVVDYIRGKIPGVKIDGNEIKSTSGNNIDFLNPNVKQLYGAPVQVYVDEQLVDDPIFFVTSIKIREVALIRFYSSVWTPKAVGLSGGSLMIYTKRGDAASTKSVPGLPKFEAYGYTGQAQLNEAMQPNDYKTLYWKPNYSFADNKIIYANLLQQAANKVVTIKIEGINNDNIPFTFTKTLTVE